MKNLFFMGGSAFMGLLTILLIITTAWFIYHFIIASNSKQTNQEKFLRRFEYGKSMGLFTMMVGIVGQMVGLYNMFDVIKEVIQEGINLKPELIFGAIKVTMICTFYGIFIYLFSIVLWFVASLIIEKKFKEI
jgi:MotA/TolQ/ExbB proton channel family